MKIISNMETESRPIKWVFDEFKKGNLFVDESFQRNYTWVTKDRISLMETIILGYPIPEIYLWATGTDPNSGETKYSIVDGQQRIRTLGSFIDNDLKLTSSGLEFEDQRYKSKTFEELESTLKSDLWGYKLSIRFIKQDVSREDIVKMFLRLNKTSNALNPQELRNAEFSGEFLKASETVSELNHWKNWGVFTDAEIRRMADIQFSSTLLIFSRAGFEDETTQTAINKMYDLLNESYPDKKRDIKEISDTLDFINSIINEDSSLTSILQKKTHLYTIFTISYSAKNKKNLDIKNMSMQLVKWYQWYETNQGVEPHWQESLNEYRRLSQEGVQKKSNRFTRHQLLSGYLGI